MCACTCVFETMRLRIKDQVARVCAPPVVSASRKWPNYVGGPAKTALADLITSCPHASIYASMHACVHVCIYVRTHVCMILTFFAVPRSSCHGFRTPRALLIIPTKVHARRAGFRVFYGLFSFACMCAGGSWS